MLADALTVSAAAFAALILRAALNSYAPPLKPVSIPAMLHFFVRVTPVLVVLVLAANSAFGVYAEARRLPLLAKWRNALLALGTATMIAFSGFYLIHLFTINRGVLILFWGLAAAGMIGSRFVADWVRRNYVVEGRHAVLPQENDQVVVIGGAGYLGSVLVDSLLRKGYRVRVLDLLVFGDSSVQAHRANRRFELIHGDYRNVATVLDAVRGAGAVVHLGGIVGDPACALNPKVTMSHNLYANKAIVEICKGVGASRFIFASSCSVYGAATSVMREDSVTAPVSLYAATKLDSEQMILAARDRIFHPVCLRFATVFGFSPRPRFDLVVNLFAAQAVFEGRIRVINPQLFRPFVHTRDIAAAIGAALESPAGQVAGEVFNVGSDRINHSIGELGDIICAVVPGTKAATESNSSDPRSYQVNFDKIHRRLGFECQVDLRSGIQEIVDACRSGAVANFRDPVYNNHNFLKERPNFGWEDENDVPIEHSQRFLVANA